jgi:hypothetical protein
MFLIGGFLEIFSETTLPNEPKLGFANDFQGVARPSGTFYAL